MSEAKDNISFEYNILGSNYMENEDELEIRIKSSSKEALEDAQNLRLEEIYNRHKDIYQNTKEVLDGFDIFSDIDT